MHHCMLDHPWLALLWAHLYSVFKFGAFCTHYGTSLVETC
jgi:hypothetical protein